MTKKYLSKALLGEYNVRIIRLADQEDDLIVNLVSQDEDTYYVYDPMVINIISRQSDVMSDESGDNTVTVSPMIAFSSYVPLAAQNILMTFKKENVELCVPPRLDIVNGYIRSVIALRADGYEKPSEGLH